MDRAPSHYSNHRQRTVSYRPRNKLFPFCFNIQSFYFSFPFVNHSMNDEFVRRSFQFAMLRSRNFSRHSSSIVGPHKSNPLVVQKILARIMLSEMKTSRLFLIFLLSSCDVVTWKAGRRCVASRWLLNFFSF